jgi:hypothetical protein
MNPDNISSTDKVEQIYLMVKENNEILKGLRRAQRFGVVMRTLYWLVILASIGGAYYYTKPLIESVQKSGVQFTDAFKMLDSLKSKLPEAQLLEQLLNSLKNPEGAQPNQASQPTSQNTPSIPPEGIKALSESAKGGVTTPEQLLTLLQAQKSNPNLSKEQKLVIEDLIQKMTVVK